MIESRCGICCSTCEFKETMNCQGCLVIKKPFWNDTCPVKDCVEKQELQHCGECNKFPCALAKQFAFDEKQGDKGVRLENCRCWQKEKVKG